MKKIRLLVIEDRPDDAVLVVKQLERGGFDVEYERVQTAQALRDALARGGWDVLLSDFSMPGFSAIEALEIAKELRPDLPFVVVSGTVGEDVAVETMRQGAHDYILKDNMTRLPAAVERELRDAETRRAQALTSAALQESEARFLRVVNNVPDIIYRVRLVPDFAVEFISSAVEQVCGFAPKELLGDGSRVLDRLHPEDRSALDDSVRNWDSDPRPIRWIHRNGEFRWLDHRHRPIFDESGQVVGIEGVARDVTAQRKLEEQLQASQRMEAVGRLAGGVAHDFNNLLTIINSLADLLVEEDNLDADALDDVRQIREAGRAASDLTNQLLAFSRRQIRQVEPVDINHVVRNIDRMLHRLIGEDIGLETVLDDELPCVEADRAQIEQILMNLAVNARDAMPTGGKLTIETAVAELDVDYAHKHPHLAPGRYVMLAVSDDGIGMDEEVRARIFEPFFTTKGKHLGTGLGLSTVYGIVKQSEGHILVYSEKGQGTTVKVYLPMSNRKRRRGEIVPLKEEPSTGSETVLLVEDSPGVRSLTARILGGAGYEVLESETEREAIRIAEQHPGTIHLLLTDVVMPEMSGKQVATEVKKLRPEVRVLYVSGYTDNAIVHHGILDRDVAFLQKPYTPTQLLGKVRGELDREG